MMDSAGEPFEDVLDFPDPRAGRALAQLVGLDAIRDCLVKQARILMAPGSLEAWSRKHHHKRLALLDSMGDRSPLFIFAGDVGTGKTALAESIGEAIARAEDIPVKTFRLSLNVRGSGAVGQMTRLLTSAFARVAERGRQATVKAGKPSAGVILVIDEADALAQNRDSAQMHHEDRAGVDALIRGVDMLTANRIPGFVIMCTNRLDSIDPAVQRRAAHTFIFTRPDDEQRADVLRRALADAGFSEENIKQLAVATGPHDGRPGFTYSDLRQRLLPAILLDAFPHHPVTFEQALRIAGGVSPSPQLGGSS